MGRSKTTRANFFSPAGLRVGSILIEWACIYECMRQEARQIGVRFALF